MCMEMFRSIRKKIFYKKKNVVQNDLESESVKTPSDFSFISFNSDFRNIERPRYNIVSPYMTLYAMKTKIPVYIAAQLPQNPSTCSSSEDGEEYVSLNKE